MSKQDGKYWDKGINLVDGCTKVSPGCDNCWSEIMSNRFGVSLSSNFQGSIVCHLERLKRFNAKKSTVWSIWNDLFHEKVTASFIAETYAKMNECSQHTYLVLTKRPNTARMFYAPAHHLLGEHIYLGTTCENQRYANERIPQLLQIDAAVRFLSLEPLLSSIDMNRNYYEGRWWGDMLHLVIVGCETGANRRPCKLEWVIDIVNQCLAAGVPVWVKQVEVDGKIIKDFDELPKEVRYRQMPGVNNE